MPDREEARDGSAIRRARLLRLSVYPLLGSLAVFFPIVLVRLHPSFVHFQNRGHTGMLLEAFGPCASISLVAVACLELRMRDRRSFIKLLPVLTPLLFSFVVLSLVTEFSNKSYDYKAYEHAAMAVANQADPYSTRPPYIYPPLVAQAMAGLYKIIAEFQQPAAVSYDVIWEMILYFYQVAQFALVLAAYFLSIRLCGLWGLDRSSALLLVTALFLVNNPLLRTFEYNQVNLWILNAFLAGILLLDRHPVAAGGAVAAGGHIKLYPLILSIPWLFAKKTRAVLGVALGFLAILFIQTDWGRNWTPWERFLAYAKAGVQEPIACRNNSIYSFLCNLFGLAGIPVHYAAPFALGLKLAVVAWAVVRFVQRENAYRGSPRGIDSGRNRARADIGRLAGHSMDAIALSLLISPSAWEHHCILAIPVALWAIVTRRSDKPWQTGIGAFLIFALPTSNLFPLSYNRLAGLLVLLCFTNPARRPDGASGHCEGLNS
jgi:hypothetical protein